MSEWLYNAENDEYEFRMGAYEAFASFHAGQWAATLFLAGECIGQECGLLSALAAVRRCEEAIYVDYMESANILLAVGA